MSFTLSPYAAAQHQATLRAEARDARRARRDQVGPSLIARIARRLRGRRQRPAQARPATAAC